MHKCRICLIEKEEELFPLNKSYKSGRATECKKCAAKRAPKYRNPVKIAMYKYGLSEEEAQQHISKTHCSICNGFQRKGKLMCIDHDHKTGKVRGAICDQCNKGLGHFRDSEWILQNAINYLKYYAK